MDEVSPISIPLIVLPLVGIPINILVCTFTQIKRKLLSHLPSRKVSTLFLRTIGLINTIAPAMLLILNIIKICLARKLKCLKIINAIEQSVANFTFLSTSSLLTLLLYHRHDQLGKNIIGKMTTLRNTNVFLYINAINTMCAALVLPYIVTVSLLPQGSLLLKCIAIATTVTHFLLAIFCILVQLYIVTTLRRLLVCRYNSFHLSWVRLNGQYFYCFLILLTASVILTMDVHVLQYNNNALYTVNFVEVNLHFILLPLLYAINDRHFYRYIKSFLRSRGKVQPITEAQLKVSNLKRNSIYTQKFTQSYSKSSEKFLENGSRTRKKNRTEDGDVISIIDQLELVEKRQYSPVAILVNMFSDKKPGHNNRSDAQANNYTLESKNSTCDNGQFK